MASPSIPVPAALAAHGRTVAEPRVSPDGRSVAFVASSAERSQLVVVRIGGGAEVVVTSDPAPAAPHPYGGGAFDWLADSSGLVFAAKDGCLWQAPVAGGAAKVVLEPHGKGADLFSPVVDPTNGWVAAVQDGADRSRIVVAPLLDDRAGWPFLVDDAMDFVLDPAWGPNGLLAWHGWNVPDMPWDGGSIRVSTAVGTTDRGIVEHTGEGSVGQPRFSPLHDALAYVSDECGWKNVVVRELGASKRRVVTEEFEHADPTWGPGQRSFAWSPDGTQIAFNRNEGGFGRLCVADVLGGTVHEIGRGVHLALSWAGDHIVCLRTGARTPTQVVAYNMTTAERTTLANGPLGGWEAFDLPEPEVVSWDAEAVDGVGTTVHGRLYRSALTSLGAPPPLMVCVHGGPTAQTTVMFSSRFAYWLSRGWDVLVPDHRGSTGWGRVYALAMHERWGELDADDTAAGIRHACAQGWCDPTRVVVTGGSAGGFSVFGVLARHPGLCAAGVSLYGVADLLDLDETTHRFEKHYLHTMIGPLPGTVTRYRARSAVQFAAKISDPLLVLQGEADRVVPPAQARAVIAAIERAGGTVESHFYDGEGHGWSRPETLVDELTRTEDFLRRHVLRWH